MANVIKYHLSHDGNPIGLFDTLDEAEYQAAMDSGWTEEEYHEKFAFVKSQCNKYGGDVFRKMDVIVCISLIKLNWMNKVILLL